MRPTGVEPATFGLKDQHRSPLIGSVSQNLLDLQLKGPAKGPNLD